MDKRELKDYYNKKALDINELDITYNSKSSYKRYFFNSRFNQVIKALKPKKGEKILDIGCGTGFYVKYLINKDCKVTGTDISKIYINQAKEYAAGAKYLVCDAANLPFDKNSFDKILMTEVIEHIPDPIDAIKEIKRVLKPGGYAVITTPNKYSPMNLAYKIKRKIRDYKFNEHLHEYTKTEFQDILSKYFEITDLIYSNYLIPYPFDNLFTQSKSEKLIEILARIEKHMSVNRFFGDLGWTMIFKVRKKVNNLRMI